jgi:hypothetical protein
MVECRKFIPKISSLHGFTLCKTIIFIFLLTNKAFSQTEVKPVTFTNFTPRDTLKQAFTDSLVSDSLLLKPGDSVLADSVRRRDTAISDTAKRKQLEKDLGIKISKDAMPSKVKAVSQDSAVMDLHHNLFYLFGKAQVNYEDVQLNAGQVEFNQATSVITAAPQQGRIKDPKDTTTEKQTFTQGSEKFTFDSVQYNFKSKRAIVRNAHSQYGEGFVHSEQVKRSPDQSIFGWHSVYTTCALDTPHFGIIARKIKIIPGRVIVTGSANLQIEGVPTPIWLPFGVFPITDRQKSGFILPTYTIEQARGLGLINGGYYFYVNDNFDFKTQANFYTKGSYAFTGESVYNNIYHYSGGFSMSYAYNKTGEDFEPGASITKDFMINWRHQSDPKSIPGQNFNASVVVGTSSYYSNNSYDPNQILQNQYSSNVTYSKSWQGTPFSLTLSALHSQNTQSHQVNVTLPDVNFHVTQLNPFQKKNAIGKKWYHKITLSYSADEINRTTFIDTTLNISKLALSNFQTGIHHSIPISASYNVLKYINMSFNINYDEYWLTQKIFQHYDTLSHSVLSDTSQGFYSARSFSAGVSFSTRIYGMKLFKHGKLRGIRHVITPTVGISYHPDFSAPPFHYYYKTYLDTPFVPYNQTTQSYYISSPFGLTGPGKSGTVNFGLSNNLQIKVRSSKDTVTGYKNVTLIDAFGVNVNYNPAVDSYRWSNISLNFRTNVLDKINISSSAAFDPYAFNYTLGRQVPQTMEDLGQGLARFQSAQFALGSNFHSKTKAGAEGPTNSEEYTRLLRNAGYNDYVNFNIPWSFNFSYSLQANKQYTPYGRNDTLVVSQNLTFQGEVQVTKRWKFTMSSGYNFTQKQLIQTSLDVYRDLHCWAMHLQTIPFGPRKSYTFTLNVKAAALQDLKLVRRRDFRDAPF